jgi:hypothetical protein
MKHDKYNEIEGLPYLIADLEQLSRDMTSLAVMEKNGPLLDLSGWLDHLNGHLHAIRESFGLQEKPMTIGDLNAE